MSFKTDLISCRRRASGRDAGDVPPCYGTSTIVVPDTVPDGADTRMVIGPWYVVVPTLNVAGWFDQEDFRGPLKIYELLERHDTKNQNFLAVGPWTICCQSSSRSSRWTSPS